jgi:sulfur carrier protein ThiS
MVTVKVFGEDREIRMPGFLKGEEVLENLGLSASSTVILKNGRPIPEDSQLEEEDSIVIIRSFSGG